MTHHAACQCGALSLESPDDPDFVIACNCMACQKRTGSAFGVGAYFRKATLAIAGESQAWSRTAASGRGLMNHFCPRCGTTVFWSLEMRPEHMGVALGCLTTEVAEPSRAIWTEHAHDWVRFPDGWDSYPRATPET